MPETRNLVHWTARQSNIIERAQDWFNPYRGQEQIAYERLRLVAAKADNRTATSIAATVDIKIDYNQPMRSSSAFRKLLIATTDIAKEGFNPLLSSNHDIDFMTAALTLGLKQDRIACMNDLYSFFESEYLKGHLTNNPKDRNANSRGLFNRILKEKIDSIAQRVAIFNGI